MTARREVIVIGGGQAGLAIGRLLADQGRDFVILEAAPVPAAAWRERWDSLVLFTPVRYDSLPGKAFPGDPDHYPTRDEVVAYLEDYARDLPVELDSRVTAVRQAGDGYIVELGDRSYETDQVVVATGPFQRPAVPAIAARLDPEVVQLHSTQYRSPDALPTGRILVVGGGNTGFQIAEELAASREVHLAIGSRQTPLPQRILGRDLFRYLEALGLMRKSVETQARVPVAAPRDADRLQPARHPPARRARPSPRRRRGRWRSDVQRRRAADGRRGDLGHGLQGRPLVDRHPRLR